MTSIQLLLSDATNRRTLASLISDQYTLITDQTVQAADLYLVDDASLPHRQEALEARKSEQAPVVCPVVLIRRERTPVTIELPETTASDEPLLVDSVLDAPVDECTLDRTIETLLARRNQTIELQERNERLEQFASTLSHELRNSLTILDGYLGIAREQTDGDALERAQRAADEMERVVEDTLMLAKNENFVPDSEPVDLSTVAQECWDIVEESDAELTVETDREVIADEAQLRRLLENLFRNAVEHATNDVTVTVGDLPDGFYVEDDGPGVPENERDAVFEEGYSPDGSGTGIGLAVVKTVVEAHGWEIQLIDGRDGGARFEIIGINTERTQTERPHRTTEREA